MTPLQLHKLRLSLGIKHGLRRGISQVEMAKTLGLHVNTYGMYERGERVVAKPVALLAAMIDQEAKGETKP